MAHKRQNALLSAHSTPWAFSNAATGHHRSRGILSLRLLLRSTTHFSSWKRRRLARLDFSISMTDEFSHSRRSLAVFLLTTRSLHGSPVQRGASPPVPWPDDVSPPPSSYTSKATSQASLLPCSVPRAPSSSPPRTGAHIPPPQLPRTYASPRPLRFAPRRLRAAPGAQRRARAR